MSEVPAATPRKERLERERFRRRRRRMSLAIPLLVLVIAAAIFLLTRDDSGNKRATRTQSGAGPTGSTTGPARSSSAKDGSTTKPSTTGSSTGAKPSSTVPVALLPANPNAPPDAPVGYFRKGKLYLEGSVSSEKVAAGYIRKARSVLGAGAVISHFKRDARVPVGPLQVIVEEQFDFPTGSSALDPKFAGLLAIGADALKKIPESTLVINGYTDNVGSAAVNQGLSEQRAQLVVDFMVKRGIPANRIIAIGRGEADPIASNATPEGRLRNRRIEGTLDGIKP